MLYLQEIVKRVDRIGDPDAYPFSMPAVRSLDRLALKTPVTFLMGENGSGKSTLLEAIAVAWGFNPEGGSRNLNFSTFETHSPLGKALTLVRGTKRARDGYFLRAESFYNIASELQRLDEQPAAAPPLLDGYGGSLHERSHGESFLALVMNRLAGDGFYLFDEPEAALSPQRQLAFLCRLDDMVKAGGQFIIATHSPILSAYPGTIYRLADSGIREVGYRETEAYQITKRFLDDYPGYLRRVLG